MKETKKNEPDTKESRENALKKKGLSVVTSMQVDRHADASMDVRASRGINV